MKNTEISNRRGGHNQISIQIYQLARKFRTNPHYSFIGVKFKVICLQSKLEVLDASFITGGGNAEVERVLQ